MRGYRSKTPWPIAEPGWCWYRFRAARGERHEDNRNLRQCHRLVSEDTLCVLSHELANVMHQNARREGEAKLPRYNPTNGSVTREAPVSLRPPHSCRIHAFPSTAVDGMKAEDEQRFHNVR